LIGRLITALVLLASAAAAVWALMPRPISVETATVARGKFVATVDEDGKTRVRERYVVAAPLSGRLSRVRLKVGDQVGADDVVAIIAPSPAPFLDPRTRREAEERLGTAEATIERTRAAVDRAKAQAEQAKNDLARTRTLVERGATTIQALERAELAMRVADRDLRAAEFANHAAEHDLGQAKALLAQYGDSARTPPEAWNVTAPVAGLVLKVNQESETIVQAGAPILELGDPLDLEIVVDVLSTDAVAIQPGAEVVIDNWGGQGTLEGRVRRIEPAAFTKISTLGVEEQRVNVLVDVTSPHDRWRSLGDAYQVDTRITVFAQTMRPWCRLERFFAKAMIGWRLLW
jgi:HlyD family secretion protein